MYQAIIMGHSRRVQADSLKLLVQKLARENIRVGENELNKHRNQIDAGYPVVVMAARKLSQNEIIKKSMSPPYLGNPFRRVEDTERVSLRITNTYKNKGGS